MHSVQLPDKVSEWPEAERELYEERAAILEFDAGMTRAEAERVAEQLIRSTSNGQPSFL